MSPAPHRVLAVVGARPNYMKVAPILWAAEESDALSIRLVHTGQHYDAALSDQFFTELGIPEPEIHLQVGSGSHGAQTARILERFEPVVQAERPDLVLVAGDVNSTVACSLAAVKLGVPVGHVEAGLRSGDRTMPEEINRVLTDAISDLLFTTAREAGENLAREGAPAASIRFVGNTMIDTLRKFEPAARARGACRALGVEPGSYALVTLHRPSNVDTASELDRVLGLLAEVGARLPVLLPLHPRTERMLAEEGRAERLEATAQVRRLPPLGYLDFLSLMADARVVLTDSGGVQEETTALGVPCLTLRPNTERPVTVSAGSNLLVSDRPERHLAVLDDLLAGRIAARAGQPELWDGRAGERLVAEIGRWFAAGAPSRVRPRGNA